MAPTRNGILALIAAAMVFGATLPAVPAAAEAAPCAALPGVDDRCETWTAVYNDPSAAIGSYQLEPRVAASADGSRVFMSAINQHKNIADPSCSPASWTVIGYDGVTGAEQWQQSFSGPGNYDRPNAITASRDGSLVVVTGGSYDLPPLCAQDRDLMTIAYDGITGEELWRAHSPGPVRDVGTEVLLSADESQVFVVVNVNQGGGDIDWAVAAYDAASGQELWRTPYAGLDLAKVDSPQAAALSPAGDLLYVGGQSGGAAQFDIDYATVAYATTGADAGSPVWEARYDGGKELPDRASDLAVDVDGRVIVTGNALLSNEIGTTDLDYATVAYDGATGAQLWESLYAGPAERGWDFGRTVATSPLEPVALVSGQSDGGGRDYDWDTVAYDTRTGAQRWSRRLSTPNHPLEFANDIAVSSDGTTGVVTGISDGANATGFRDLNRSYGNTIAYAMDDGDLQWSARLTGDDDTDSFSPRGVVMSSDGSAFVAGQLKNNLQTDESDNLYDAMLVAYRTDTAPPTPTATPTATPSRTPSVVGKWSIESSPNASATQHNFVNGVTCVSPSDCWSVGYYRAESAYQSLIQHWDGTSWSLVSSPDTSASQDDFVHGVACASSSECWAVGFSWSRTASAYQQLILRWDGAEWSVVPSPNDSPVKQSFLFGVTCASSSDCWAVGHQQIGALGGGFGPRQTLIKHWDGTSWTAVASPNTLPTQSNTLSDVTCVTPEDCWAVGYYNPGNAEQTLTAHWDGEVWAIVPSDNASALERHFLNGVTCASASDCWATGVRNGGVDQTVMLRWNGASWAVVPSPNTDPGLPNVLFDVACTSPSECFAVGYHKAGNPLQTLIERWDGDSWSLVSSPNSSPGQTNTLRAVTCSSASDCWAVGNYYNAQSISRTLALRYTKSATPSPTPTPTESAAPETTTTSFTPDSHQAGQYSDATTFEGRVVDSSGDPLAGQNVTFEIAGGDAARSFPATTDEDGVARVNPTLIERPGPFQVTVGFAGSDAYEPSSDTMSFVVAKEDSALELSVHGEDDDKTLRARLSDLDTSSEGIADRMIDFYSDGEVIGSGATDADGVASVLIPPRHRGNNRTYEAVFEGDDFYLTSSDERTGKGGNAGRGGWRAEASRAYSGKMLLM